MAPFSKGQDEQFDGSNLLGWVTQMEHYFSIHGNTDDLHKLQVGVLYLDVECWQCTSNGGNGIRILTNVTFLGPSLCKYFMLLFNVTLTMWDAWKNYAKWEQLWNILPLLSN
jgi:hypothetical protein